MAELAGRLGRREDAAAGATGGVVDDVGAALVHALGRGLALGRVVEAAEVRRLGEVLDVDLDVRVDRLGAGDVARLELLDEVGTLTPPTKPTWPVLDFSAAAAPTRKEPCSSAKVIWSTLGPFESADASSTIAKWTSGLALATLPTALRVGEADRDDVGVAGVDELLQALLAGGLVLTVDRRGLLDVDARARSWPCRGRRRRRR